MNWVSLIRPSKTGSTALREWDCGAERLVIQLRNVRSVKTRIALCKHSDMLGRLYLMPN